MHSAYFHEDDYCQIELAPVGNWEFCAKHMGEINSFSTIHRDGGGWTDMVVRDTNPAPLKSLGISRGELIRSMPTRLQQVDQVFTGYSSYQQLCPQTMAFGANMAVMLFAQYDETEVITAAWCSLDISTEHDVNAAMELMDSLLPWPLLLADWGWSVLLRIRDRDLCHQYFTKRLQVFGQANPRSPRANS
ncbi:MAG: hypothetical protein OHK0012_14920 [Synechococcales cyanobacterium]